MGIELAQTGPTLGALVTAVFAVVPFVCGGWVVWRVLRAEFTLGARTRIGFGAAAGAALITWAGFIAGPAILLIAAVTPRRLIER